MQKNKKKETVIWNLCRFNIPVCTFIIRCDQDTSEKGKQQQLTAPSSRE